MIVVDIGCEAHAGKGRFAGAEESVHTLCDRFKPRFFYGFDPQLPRGDRRKYRRTRIILSAEAAWLYDGTVLMHMDGDRSGVTHDEANEVPCFDFPQWLQEKVMVDEVVLKLDCEGAEYPLLWALHDRVIDARLKLILVEWHEGIQWRGDFPSYGWHLMGRPPLRCEVEEW